MKLVCLHLLAGWSLGHMFLAEPPVRKFQSYSNGVGQNEDYTIHGPLEDYRIFPCQGKQRGPVVRNYTAGSSITATIGGDPSGAHGGGHCQFAVTYNEREFVVLKTVLGDCISKTNTYQVPVPSRMPNGRVTFVWTWVNRLGNREFYMNCADIRITGGARRGSLKGKDILVAHIDVPNHRRYEFLEQDFDSHAKQYYSEQPIVSIRPRRVKRKKA